MIAFDFLLREIVAEQGRQRVLLGNILQALDRGRGPRAAHVALLVTVADVIGDRGWTGVQLFAHADVSPALREALLASDLTNARELGWLCRRLEGNPRPGLWLDRVGASRDGIVWRVRVSDSQTRVE